MPTYFKERHGENRKRGHRQNYLPLAREAGFGPLLPAGRGGHNSSLPGGGLPLREGEEHHAPATPEVRWVEPKVVVQVSALEITKAGHLRAPVFLRTRYDKLPQECTAGANNLRHHLLL